MKTSPLHQLLRRPALALAALTAVGLAAIVPLSGKDTPKLKLDDTPLTLDSKPTFTFGPIIKKVSPSVVNIYTAKTIRDNPRLSPLFDDPLFGQFFGGGGRWENVPRERREQSLGSGVIVSSDGYILTNNHVVENADEIKVALADNVTTYSAKLVGADPQTDIAVIKVEAKDLPAIIVADSDRIEVGDVVLALGNPFGVGQTVTMGIVSAKGRGGMGIVDYEDFIQTDASINPGNSGGALVDAAGRLVGINSAILSRTGGNQGIGFAIPINLARDVMERLVAEGKVTRGQLGVMIQPVTPELAKEFKLPQNAGALVGGVTPQSPADEAGIKAGDVIVEFNGKKVSDSRHLRLMVGQTAPGTSVTVKALRDGKEQTFNVKLAETKTEGLAKGDRSGGLRRGSGSDALDGVSVEDIDARARRQFELPAQIRGGALIVAIAPGSSAADAGLKPGDVILEINRQPIESADDAIAKSRDLQGGRVLLRVWSGGGSRYVILESNPSR
jgi:serine protease Do